MPSTVQHIEKLIHQSRHFEAIESVKTALTRDPDNLRLKQLLALATSKSGSSLAAMKYFQPIYNDQPDDPESSGIMGGIYKGLFRKTREPQYGKLAADTYQKNFELTGNYYTGINTATMMVLSGQAKKGREIAIQVVTSLSSSADDGLWEMATLAEAHLLLKDKPKAKEFYLKARKMAGNDWGKINSIGNQLWLLDHYIMVPRDILKLFEPPHVTAFAGHMIDHPSRQEPRFTPEMENAVQLAIVTTIRNQNIQIGYCSLACGADILFAEAMLSAGKDINVYLPFNINDFRETSVSFAGHRWQERFEEILTKTRIHYVSTERYNGDDFLFDFLSKVIMGAAVLRANTLNSIPNMFAVTSKYSLERKMGGTRDIIQSWPSKYSIFNIDIDPYRTTFPSSGNYYTHLKTDIREVNGSERKPGFILCTRWEGSDSHEILTQYGQMWADEDTMLYSMDVSDNEIVQVFKTILGAVESAAKLSELARSICKEESRENELKTGLHAGPVCLSNISENRFPECFGDQIDLTKKMLNNSSAGVTAVTEQFASILILSNDKYTLEHAGILEMEDNNVLNMYQLEFDP
ncbi:MAG: TRAFs-binding domain-containing protein [Cyclobacteriaceae bacterium]|nr:TRAFs-binding domain-containing protein [Cyclobacteriaceae bacterium]